MKIDANGFVSWSCGECLFAVGDNKTPERAQIKGERKREIMGERGRERDNGGGREREREKQWKRVREKERQWGRERKKETTGERMR